MTTLNQIANIEHNSVDNINTSYDYWQVVSYMADCVVDLLNEAIECEDVTSKEEIEVLFNDSALHETIDQSEYAIYSCHHLSILQYSDNDDYCLENFGADHLAECLKKGLTNLHASLASWALYADVQEKVSEHLKDFEWEENEAEEEE